MGRYDFKFTSIEDVSANQNSFVLEDTIKLRLDDGNFWITFGEDWVDFGEEWDDRTEHELSTHDDDYLVRCYVSLDEDGYFDPFCSGKNLGEALAEALEEINLAYEEHLEAYSESDY